MNIREIIEAATKNRWWIGSYWEDEGLYSGDVPIIYVDSYGNFQVNKNDANFITTFNPEHVALTEAVVEAAVKMEQAGGWRVLLKGTPLFDSLERLLTYRKAHDLTTKEE